jgi:CRP-like cAMP-binding protein
MSNICFLHGNEVYLLDQRWHTGHMAIRRTDPVARRLETLGMSRTSAELLSQRGTFLQLPAGTTLCTEGERGLEAFMLVDGEAHVRGRAADVTVGPGSVIGELATLDPRRTRNADVVAETDVSVLVFDVRTYRSLADEADLHARLAPERAAA